MSYTDAQIRNIITGFRNTLQGLGTLPIRGIASIVALDALCSPTSAPSDEGNPPPTSPFPPPADPTNGAAEVIRRAAYAPAFGASWECTKSTSPITYRQV